MNHLTAIKNFVPTNPQEESDQGLILKLLENHPENLLSRECGIAHITSSGLILNKSLDKLLMVHHHIYNTWAWTGGHADGNADLLAVALEEGCEETGVQALTPLTEEIMSVDILPVKGHFKRGTFVSAHLHLNVSYVLIADETAPLTVNPAENSGVAWIEVDRLEEASSEPEMIAVYRKIIRRAQQLQRRGLWTATD